MMDTIYAYKQVNTQTWDSNGKRLVVTVVRVPSHTVVQVKSNDTDGYNGVQVGFGEQKKHRVSKPVMGHLKKANLKNPVRDMKEILVSQDDAQEYSVGATISSSDVLSVGDIVKVTGFTKGTGFTGVMKRWNFSGGPRTHGQSDRERAPGSIGQGTDPGKVWKGKKMAGRDGNLKVTQKNLQVVKIDENTNEVWLRGTTPGHRGSLLEITKVGQKDFVGIHGQSSADVSADADTQEEKKAE